MNSMSLAQPQWICNGCGLRSPVIVPDCSGCGKTRGRKPKKVVYMSPVDSSGSHMVQNNVTNVTVDGSMYFSEARAEIIGNSEPTETRAPSPERDVFYKFFMFTCSAVFWTGMAALLSVVLFIWVLVCHAMFR